MMAKRTASSLEDSIRAANQKVYRFCRLISGITAAPRGGPADSYPVDAWLREAEDAFLPWADVFAMAAVEFGKANGRVRPLSFWGVAGSSWHDAFLGGFALAGSQLITKTLTDERFRKLERLHPANAVYPRLHQEMVQAIVLAGGRLGRSNFQPSGRWSKEEEAIRRLCYEGRIAGNTNSAIIAKIKKHFQITITDTTVKSHAEAYARHLGLEIPTSRKPGKKPGN